MARIVPNREVSLNKKVAHNRRPKNEGKDPAYLRWLHKLPCCVTLTEPGGAFEARIVAHHPTVGRGRAAKKEDDATAVPVREDHHSDAYPTGLHRGEVKFWNLTGINPTDLADDLYAAFKAGKSPGKGRMIINGHRYLAAIRIDCGVKVFQEKGDL